MDLFLGIDSSCYTSSVAVVDEEGTLIYDRRQLLKVETGERGLMQSQAVFQHLQNLPELIAGIDSKTLARLTAVGVSARPRPAEGSYMPVFTVGTSFALVLAAARNVKLRETTHQEGHLVSGLWSAGAEGQMLMGRQFLAVHLSGGTSELLLVECRDGYLHINILGGSTDLHAGQFIDRVGVRLGLSFPAGPALEKLASGGGRTDIRIPSAVRGYEFSFSGPEVAAARLILRGGPPAEVALAVEHCIAITLEKVVRKAVVEQGLADVLFVGGVAANSYIRDRLREKLEHPAVGARLLFAEPKFSGDNAVGAALTAMGFLGGE